MSNDAPVLSSVNIVVAQQNVTLEIGVDGSIFSFFADLKSRINLQ